MEQGDRKGDVISKFNAEIYENFLFSASEYSVDVIEIPCVFRENVQL
jgi:hypothetical protein